jgi:hypothetical protein
MDGHTSRSSARTSPLRLAAGTGALVVIAFAYHVFISREMRANGLRLGAVGPDVAPLYAYIKVHFDAWLIAPAATLGVFLAALARSRFLANRSDRRAWITFGLVAPVVAVSVAMIDGGPAALVGPFAARADLEYWSAAERVSDPIAFVRSYPGVLGRLPMHAQTHPPGGILFFRAVRGAFGPGPWPAAWAVIAFGVVNAMIVFGWARRVGGPGAARRAAALFVVAPGVVLFTATSTDAVFAAPLIASMACFDEAIASTSRRSPLWGTLSGLMLGVAGFFTYSVAVAGLFCVIAATVAIWSKPRAVILAGTGALMGFVVFHAVLWVATGFDPVATFRAALGHSHRIMAGTAHEEWARHAHLSVANLAAFLIGAGLPLVAAAVGRVPTSESGRPHRLAIATALTLLIASCVPAYTLEVERIWIFVVPLVAIVAAVRLDAADDNRGDVTTSVLAVGLAALQTIVMEVILVTYW